MRANGYYFIVDGITNTYYKWKVLSFNLNLFACKNFVIYFLACDNSIKNNYSLMVVFSKRKAHYFNLIIVIFTQNIAGSQKQCHSVTIKHHIPEKCDFITCFKPFKSARCVLNYLGFIKKILPDQLRVACKHLFLPIMSNINPHTILRTHLFVDFNSNINKHE